VQMVQPSSFQPPLNRPPPEPQVQQLGSRDDAVLPEGQVGQPLMASLSQTTYMGAWDRLASHAGSVPSYGARVARGLCRFTPPNESEA